MDKRSPKILIKVNGTETNYKEEPTKQDAPPQEEFQWMLPSEQILQHNVVPFRAGNELSVEPKKRKGRRKQMILTVGTAVLLGTGFGFGVLHVLDGTKEEKSMPAAASVTSTTTTAPAEKQTKSSEQQTQQSAALEELAVYVIQGNVFSTAERGQAALDDMKKKGMPGALINSDGKTFLFIGIANDEKGAKKLTAFYKAKGFAVLEKRRVLTDKQVPAAFKKYEGLIGKTEKSLRTLIEQTSTVYTAGKISNEQWSELDKSVKELTKEGKSVEKAEVKKLLTYVSLSCDALQEYKETKDEKTFVKLQQLLLDGLVSYETVLTGKDS